MKILLTDGSGLTARQTAGRLHELGHTVGVLSADPFGLSRFTRSVRRWHRTPPFGTDPIAWLSVAAGIVRRERYDLLFPTQEQVTVLSWAAGSPLLDGVPTVVPAFDALRAVQDKIASRSTLDRLAIPQPAGATIFGDAQLRTWDRFPAFVKTPIGTASTGVRRVEGPQDLDSVADEWSALGVFDAGAGVVVQEAVDGPLVMIQAVFDHGRMIAFHSNLRVREGVRGGASHKRSTHVDGARSAIERLGTDLGWHGALSADAILTDDGFAIIDVNPRLVEPGNAWRAGVDLVGAMLDIAGDGTALAQPDGRDGVRTHQLLLAVLARASGGRGRRGVVRELRSALGHCGDYSGSAEELTPVAGDWRAAIPVTVATLATLVSPASWKRFADVSVTNYAISPEGWNTLCNGVCGG